MNTNNMIEMNHISKTFGNRTALKDINISIKPGEILGFLGPSGAGKTTTIKILTGQLLQTSGEATILNQDTRKINEEIYSKIGIVTDNSGLYEKLTVYENMGLFAKILDVDKSRIDYLLEKVGLANDKKKLAGKLSKGMGQRLVLARAILHKPRVLFLDEPTSGLDPSTALDIHKLLLELKAEGTAIFLTTHNMMEATKLCDEVALLYQGNIVERGTPEEICLRYNDDKQYRIKLENGQTDILKNTMEDSTKIMELMNSNQLASIHSSEPTLETVFLRVTGKELQ